MGYEDLAKKLNAISDLMCFDLHLQLGSDPADQLMRDLRVPLLEFLNLKMDNPIRNHVYDA